MEVSLEKKKKGIKGGNIYFPRKGSRHLHFLQGGERSARKEDLFCKKEKIQIRF